MKFSGLLKGLIIEQGRYEILKKTYAQPKKKGDKVKPENDTTIGHNYLKRPNNS